MPLLPGLRHREDGVTLAELMASIAILLVLVAIAVPTFFGAANEARDTKAQSELRVALSPLKTIIGEDPNAVGLDGLIKEITPSASFDPAGLTGIRIESATDGSVCMWRTSDSGLVYGVWEPIGSRGATLYGEFASMPALCPVAADATTQGYTLNGW